MSGNKYLETFREWYKENYRKPPAEAYKNVGNYSPLPRTRNKLQEFSKLIREYSMMGGIFVSYCVNEIYSGLNITLNLEAPFSYLGLYTKKNWIIKGNVRNFIGSFMKGGKMVIKGNVGDYVGNWMEGGKIFIEGNVGDYVGSWMEGGEIFIKGNAGKEVGCGMQGGKIFIEGEVESINKDAKGEIYYKGKLLNK